MKKDKNANYKSLQQSAAKWKTSDETGILSLPFGIENYVRFYIHTLQGFPENIIIIMNIDQVITLLLFH